MGKKNYFEDVDPNDRLDFTIKYVDWLAGDQITGSSWTADASNPAGGVIDATSFTTGTTTMWMISGTAGFSYKFDNLAGTLLGRRVDKDIMVMVRDE